MDFDVIYIDPPYNHDLEKEVILSLTQKRFKNPETRSVVEAALDNDMSYVNDTKFVIEKVKAYKTNKHVFLRLKESEEE